jgi:hypothetical protein
MNIGLKMEFEKEKKKKRRNQRRPPFQPRRPKRPIKPPAPAHFFSSPFLFLPPRR